MQPQTIALLLIFIYTSLHSQTATVTNPADSGGGTLRQAMLDINDTGDASNTINLQIPGNTPISVGSDLPLTKKNTEIISTGKQTIDGNGQYRLFATIMADLSINNCTLQNGAAIGGSIDSNNGGGLGCGGAIYIDRGKTLVLKETIATANLAKGGTSSTGGRGGAGASFSDGTKNQGGDYPGTRTTGGAYDNSPFLIGYGGGGGGGNNGGDGGGNGAGQDGTNTAGGNGGYCGGGGGSLNKGGGGG